MGSEGMASIGPSGGTGMEGREGMGLGLPAAVVEPQAADVIMARRRLSWVLESLHIAIDDRSTGAANVDSGKAGLVVWMKQSKQAAELIKEANETIKAISQLHTEVNDTALTKPDKYAEFLRTKITELTPAAAAAEAEPAPAAEVPAPLTPPQ